MQSRELQSFIAVAQHRSFSAAGHQIGLTQQAVSRLIASLETRYSVKLFTRHTRQVDLTAEGEKLLGIALPAHAALQKAVEWLDSQRKQLSPTIRIGYTMSARSLVLNTLLPRLRQHGFEAMYSELPSAQQESDLLQDRLDLGFVHPPLVSSTLKSKHLSTEHMLVVLPPKHRLAKNKNVSLADLRDESWILFEKKQGPDLYERIVSGLTARNGHKPDIKGHLMPHPVRADMAMRSGCVTLIAPAAVQSMQESAAFVPCSDITLPLALGWNPLITHATRDRVLSQRDIFFK